MTFCQACNDDTETVYNDSRGESYCTRCGAVLEENCIVEAVTFTEGSNGVVRANGQFIPSSGFGSGSMNFTSKYNACAGREQALQRGYANIQRIADRLQLQLHIVEAAQRIYLMAVQRNFTIGRITSHVAAACLYISCRREKTEQMLIDFSDVLCSPVRILGRVFVKLIRVLRIDVPTIDPSLFIERFASQIDLEGKANLVVETSLRLVQAMNRDWICTGRRPTGLCGASLLIAARFHGLMVSAEQISQVIRMASSTVNKRLNEFKHTSTAQLKLHEFESVDLLSLPILRGPPCTETTRKPIYALPEHLGARSPRDDLLPDSVVPYEDNDEHFLEIPATPLKRPEISKNTQNSVMFVATEEELFVSEPSSVAIASLADRLVAAIEQQVPSSDHGDPLNKTEVSSEECTVEENFENDPIKLLLCNVKEKAPDLIFSHPSSVVHTNIEQEASAPSFENNLYKDSCHLQFVEESFTDVSDTEIDSLILSEKERKAKALMWDELMKNVMPQVYRRFTAQKRKETSTKPRKIRRHLNLTSNEDTTDVTIAGSVRRCLEAKNPLFAKHLNSSVLDALFTNSRLPDNKSDQLSLQKQLSENNFSNLNFSMLFA